jgi:hypothetical protein
VGSLGPDLVEKGGQLCQVDKLGLAVGTLDKVKFEGFVVFAIQHSEGIGHHLVMRW